MFDFAIGVGIDDVAPANRLLGLHSLALAAIRFSRRPVVSADRRAAEAPIGRRLVSVSPQPEDSPASDDRPAQAELAVGWAQPRVVRARSWRAAAVTRGRWWRLYPRQPPSLPSI